MDRSNIKIYDKRSINLTCMIKVEGEAYAKPRRFKYDTGAQLTCMNAESLNLHISEEELRKQPDVVMVEGIGIDESSTINYYRIQVEDFKVAGIDLGSIPVYITFNPKAKKRLLGLDIIMLMNTQLNFDEGVIQLSKTERFLEFKKRKLKLEVQDMIEMGIYSADLCGED